MTIVKRNLGNINHVFDELLNGFPTLENHNHNNWHTVPVNIHETKEAYHLEVLAPGRKKEDFKVELDKGLLTIGYEQKEVTADADYKTVRREFKFKSFKRTFTIDDAINTDKIEAKYEDGVLKLLLPKKETLTVAPKTVTIQ